MKLALEDFMYEGEHYDRFEIEVRGMTVDDFLSMNKLKQMEFANQLKDRIQKAFNKD